MMKEKLINYGKDLLLLSIRLVLAYGFYHPAMKKISNPSDITGWFAHLGIPFPTLNAYLAMGTELLGVALLALGFFTRFISVPLIFTMVVAITFVHLDNGFEAGNNGFEIPVYYILMLSTLILYGSGKFSIDFLIQRQKTGKHEKDK